MIINTLQTEIKEALKAGDDIRVSTLRLLSNALHNEEIAKQKELTEEEELQIVRRQLKQREEAIEAYTKGGRPTLAEKEKKEAEILKGFLLASPAGGPAQMGAEELEKIMEQTISETGASGMQDFGRVMGAVMGKVKGKVDGKAVGEMVKQKLQIVN